MSKGRFWYALSLCCALLVLGNVGITLLARNTNPRRLSRKMAESHDVRFLAVGNSLIEAGFDAGEFRKVLSRSQADAATLNAGLGASHPVEHLLLLRDAYRTNPLLDSVYYGYSDFQLTQLQATLPGDLVGNRAMLYDFPSEIVGRYYGWSFADRFVFDAMRLVPAIRERGTIWQKVEGYRRRLGQLGMPPEATNRYGRVSDFQALESYDRGTFARECRREILDGQRLHRPIIEMIRLARKHRGRIVFVEMPMHPFHQQQFYRTAEWEMYRSYLRSLLQAEGGDCIQAGDWIQNGNQFLDVLTPEPIGSVRVHEQAGSI